MKANQAFVNNEEAVSPVIGVILMVAITVVLAAVVFVLVSDLGGGSESAPTMSFSKNEGQDRLEVVSAEADADWNRLTVVVAGCTQLVANQVIYAGAATPDDFVNQAATAAGAALNAAGAATACGAGDDKQVSSTVDIINAGDFLEFCASEGTAAADGATNVIIRIVDTTANSQVYEGTFADIAAC